VRERAGNGAFFFFPLRRLSGDAIMSSSRKGRMRDPRVLKARRNGASGSALRKGAEKAPRTRFRKEAFFFFGTFHFRDIIPVAAGRRKQAGRIRRQSVRRIPHHPGRRRAIGVARRQTAQNASLKTLPRGDAFFFFAVLKPEPPSMR